MSELFPPDALGPEATTAATQGLTNYIGTISRAGFLQGNTVMVYFTEQNNKFAGYYWTNKLNPLVINVALAALQSKAPVLIQLNSTAYNSEMFTLYMLSN